MEETVIKGVSPSAVGRHRLLDQGGGRSGGWLVSPVTWPECAGGVPVSDRRHQVGFLGPPHTGRVTRGSYVGNCGLASTARWFWRWVTSRRSLMGEGGF